jgi:hypothetical protein
MTGLTGGPRPSVRGRERREVGPVVRLGREGRMGRGGKKKRRERRWAEGLGREDGPRPDGKGRVWFFFFFSNPFLKPTFKPLKIQSFTQLFSKLFTNLFTTIFKTFHKYFKTFKSTQQPKLMHFNMMHKHLDDSNDLNVV